jgi:hypothetical protein
LKLTPYLRPFQYFLYSPLTINTTSCPFIATVLRQQLFYFSRAAHDWPTGIIAPSPVLERLGLYKPEEQKEAVSGLEYTRARVAHSWDRVRYGDEAFKRGFVHKGLEVKTNYD